jgi:hypothetical protein
MEYNTTNIEPDNKLDHYVNTLQWSNEDYGPGINDMFLNNLDPTFYSMQMQTRDVLTHAQMKRQVDANKFIDAQRPEIEGLIDINTFKFIHKTKLPAKTRYIARPDLDIQTKTPPRRISKEIQSSIMC